MKTTILNLKFRRETSNTARTYLAKALPRLLPPNLPDGLVPRTEANQHVFHDGGAIDKAMNSEKWWELVTYPFPVLRKPQSADDFDGVDSDGDDKLNTEMTEEGPLTRAQALHEATSIVRERLLKRQSEKLYGGERKNGRITEMRRVSFDESAARVVLADWKGVNPSELRDSSCD